MKKRLLAFSLALIPMLGFSQNRSESEAIAVAQGFWGGSISRAQLKAVPQKAIASAKARVKANGTSAADSKQSFYVINDEEHGRFVIVSSDDRLYKILGYSDNGCFDADSAPEGLLEMLGEYDAQYTSVYTALDEIPSMSSVRQSVQAVEPLIKTKWGQAAPYNNDCPKNKRATDESKCMTGCVATAMAQVMNYYQYPNVGQGVYLYQSATQGHFLMQYFSDTTFDWSLLTDNYNETSTDEEKSEVAKLMKACGVSVSMDYGNTKDGQSGAAPTDIPYAMINYFGYNSNVVYKNKDYYLPEEWDTMIMQELNAGRPILYGGFDSDNRNGHRFILDGCDKNGLYHFNFGWTFPGLNALDGYGNGYYSLDVLKPTDILMNVLAGEQVDLGDFSYNQSMICNISPESIGTHEDVFYSSSSFYMPSSIKLGVSGNFNFSATNYSASSSSTDISNPKFKGELGIGLYDADFKFIKDLYHETNESKLNHWQHVTGSFIPDAETFSEGSVFYIAPYARGEGYETTTRIRSKQGKTEYYLAETENGKVKLTANGLITPHNIVTGTYVISVNGGEKEWQVELVKDNNAENRYVLSKLDPAVNDIKEVYAISNSSGTQLTISLNQNIQENTYLYNIADPDKIVISVNSGDNSMYINDTWGSMQIMEEGDNSTQRELSRYSNTKISYGTLDPVPSIVVSSPVISISQESNVVSIFCGTDNAKIYYTVDGTTPTTSSYLYTEAFEVNNNCVIKCIANVGDYFSEVVSRNVNWFKMSEPRISLSEDQKYVIMECEDQEARIYYTDDNSDPSVSSILYDGPISNTNTTTYKAIAVKENFNNSSIVTFIADGCEPDLAIIVVDNKAGELSQRISDTSKNDVLSITISGQLNGTDIKYLREILQKGKLAKLDISDATIVSGGEKYDGIYSTEENVIGNNMFANSKSLISIALPQTVTSINSFAFSYCDRLSSLTIPEMCNFMSEYALSGCKELKNIYVEEGNQTFKSCDGILFSLSEDVIYKVPFAKDVYQYEIPASVKKIEGRAFEGTNITSLKLPEKLEQIGRYAFTKCGNILDVVIPNSVSILGDGAFENCKNLKTIVLSSAITKLESFTFNYCVNLRSLFVTKALQSISQHALNNCYSLQQIDVDVDNEYYCSYNGVLYSKDMKTLVYYPKGMQNDEYYIADGVETIFARAFEKCSKLQKVVVPSSMLEIGSYAFEGSSVSTINLPNSIEKIGEYAFSSCKSLHSLSIPESVERIEQGLLSYCDQLEYVCIPMKVNFVGLSAFGGCKSLQEIDCWISDINEVNFRASGDKVEVFKNIKSDCYWHVPVGCADSYKSQPWWISTWNIADDLIVGIETIHTVSDLSIVPIFGAVEIVSPTSTTINIYNLQGRIVDTVNTVAGVKVSVPLSSGIYVVEGKKVHVK